MKKVALILALVLVTALAGCASSPASPAESPENPTPAQEPSAPDSSSGSKKLIGYYMDAADDYYKGGFEVFSHIAKEEGWDIIDVVGQGTAPEQISAIENFITNQVDAIICVQNSPQASAECLSKADAAGIPMFFLSHSPPNDPGLAGFVGYDWVQSGKYAAESAIAYGAKNIIMIEGKMGQGSAAGQTEGFVAGYADAGLDVGDAMTIGGKGGADLQIVFWGSGGWFADPAKKAMQDAITTLGPDGFDGAYVQNDEMMDGAIQALEEAGLNPGDYWLGSSNGKEKSWKWVEEGKVAMDVNQTCSLEADLLSQMVKAHFAGESHKKAVFSGLIPFDKTTMDLEKLIPYDANAYFEKRATGVFEYDLNNPMFGEMPGY